MKNLTVYNLAKIALPKLGWRASIFLFCCRVGIWVWCGGCSVWNDHRLSWSLTSWFAFDHDGGTFPASFATIRVLVKFFSVKIGARCKVIHLQFFKLTYYFRLLKETLYCYNLPAWKCPSLGTKLHKNSFLIKWFFFIFLENGNQWAWKMYLSKKTISFPWHGVVWNVSRLVILTCFRCCRLHRGDVNWRSCEIPFICFQWYYLSHRYAYNHKLLSSTLALWRSKKITTCILVIDWACSSAHGSFFLNKKCSIALSLLDTAKSTALGGSHTFLV